MDTIQVIFFLISGFLVSRLIIKVKLPQRIVFFFIGEKHLSLSRILLYLLALSAFLSLFIPNAITVLTLLPILELLRQSFDPADPTHKNVPTLLALSAIYGANIGGMGSLTGTPANGILVSYAELKGVPGSEMLTFAAWLVWGIPLVICFVAVAWLTLAGVFRTWRFAARPIRLPFDAGQTHHPLQMAGLIITLVFFLSSLLFSALLMQYPAHGRSILITTGVFTALFSLFLFSFPLAGWENTGKRPLLTLKDCYSDLPARGFVFVGVAVALAGILYLFKLHLYFAELAEKILPGELSVFAIYLVIALITSFATEVLSNTAVQLSFFIVALPLAEPLGFSAVQGLIIITLSCTCAFMSPIATGVNGLAFGGVKGVSLSRMLAAGFVMNIAGALLISYWALFVIGGVLGIR